MDETIYGGESADEGTGRIDNGWARRADRVGQLAWQLAGEDGGRMDPTAAQPLIDALGDAGADGDAWRLRMALVRHARRCRSLTRPARARDVLGDFRRDMADSMAHLLYDVNAGPLADMERAVALAAVAEAAPEEARAELSIVRIDVGYPADVGERVSLPDGRRGVVVQAADGSGRVGVLPRDGDAPTSAARARG